jgi:hypothetical protein
VGRYGGDVAFVRLGCDPATNAERIVIPFGRSLEIDSTAPAPEASARRIAVHLALSSG